MSRARIEIESKTMAAMVALYCRHHHDMHTGLCPECQKLMDYAARQLEHCTFANEKPVCSQCTIHCYSVGRREQIKKVMRYAGPRMLMYHPFMAIRHLIDKFRYSISTSLLTQKTR
ncbi:nitrous oxide-stimulated promoter family protein [bacterium]|nr:nitrous oxide-stimulated promoter family protein [bacterium]